MIKARADHRLVVSSSSSSLAVVVGSSAATDAFSRVCVFVRVVARTEIVCGVSTIVRRRRGEKESEPPRRAPRRSSHLPNMPLSPPVWRHRLRRRPATRRGRRDRDRDATFSPFLFDLLVRPFPFLEDYFGEKIALYFCWLGHYTTFLIPAAVLGVVTCVLPAGRRRRAARPPPHAGAAIHTYITNAPLSMPAMIGRVVCHPSRRERRVTLKPSSRQLDRCCDAQVCDGGHPGDAGRAARAVVRGADGTLGDLLPRGADRPTWRERGGSSLSIANAVGAIANAVRGAPIQSGGRQCR